MDCSASPLSIPLTTGGNPSLSGLCPLLAEHEAERTGSAGVGKAYRSWCEASARVGKGYFSFASGLSGGSMLSFRALCQFRLDKGKTAVYPILRCDGACR